MWLYRLLRGVPEYGPYMAEIKILKERSDERYATMDVWIPGDKIGIMVDGQHHFPAHNAGHHGHSSTDQQTRDAIFNLAVLADGGIAVKGIVRLHHKDTATWMDFVHLAVALARLEVVQGFVLFSGSYRQEAMVFFKTI